MNKGSKSASCFKRVLIFCDAQAHNSVLHPRTVTDTLQNVSTMFAGQRNEMLESCVPYQLLHATSKRKGTKGAVMLKRTWSKRRRHPLGNGDFEVLSDLPQ